MRERLPLVAAVLALVCVAAAVVVVTVTLTQGQTAADYVATINEKCDGLAEQLDTELTVDRDFDDAAAYVDTMEQRAQALTRLHDEVADLAVPEDAERPDRWLDHVAAAVDDMAEIIEMERKTLSGGGNRDVAVAMMANVYVDDVDAADRAAADYGLDSCADTTSWRGPYTGP